MGVMFGLTMGCDSFLLGEAENDIIRVIPSPDGKHEIVLFSRGSGATSGFNMQATILEKGEALPNECGNVFIVDKGEATVSWRSDQSVQVVFDPEVRIFKQEASVSDVTFDYQKNTR